jgi:tetratricopeptide (TPR) repeat protein|tara:strand:+ start:42700 stop:44253 length:1554 start_codon:yes stop_codon:yes gene_type:complete
MDGGNASAVEYGQNPEFQYKAASKTGAYLSSRIARMENDWEAASYYFDDVIDDKETNLDFHYQAMIMAMNAGRYEESIDHADFLAKNEYGNALVSVISAMGAIIEGEYKLAGDIMSVMPEDNLSKLMRAPMAAWIDIQQGNKAGYDKLDLTKPFVAYQAIIAADVSNNNDLIASFAEKSQNLNELPPAIQRHLAAVFERREISYAQELVVTGEYNDKRNVANVREGVAWIYYDLAMPLYLQYQDETGRLLFNMALALTPELTEARIRVAEYAAIHGRTKEAIQALRNVTPESQSYTLVQKIIAELMVANGEVRPALSILNKLAAAQKDIGLYVQIGGIYAKNEMYKESLEAYNAALKLAGDASAPDYWQVFFARGRIHDAMGRWNSAEKDLLQALEYQPQQPFLLNYIGYSWADRGKNLDQALKMIEQAASLQPNDGSIRDSLGWVYYRLGDYAKAAIQLEQAAALLPYDPVVNDHLGDAYWKVGRHAEAEFQWKRALSNANTETLITQLEEKLSRY